LRRTLDIQEKKNGPQDSRLAGPLANLGSCLLRQGKSAEAEPILRRCLAIREARMPGEWPCFNTRSQLGGSLLGQGKNAEAEPLLLAGYEGLKAREATIPPQARVRLSEAAGRIVALYDAWGKPDQARAWLARLGLAELPADVFAPPAAIGTSGPWAPGGPRADNR
jgi:hypothetical protein